MKKKKTSEKKEAKQRASTRQLIGAKAVTDYSLVTYGQGELVYFIYLWILPGHIFTPGGSTNKQQCKNSMKRVFHGYCYFK